MTSQNGGQGVKETPMTRIRIMRCQNFIKSPQTGCGRPATVRFGPLATHPLLGPGHMGLAPPPDLLRTAILPGIHLNPSDFRS